MFRYKMPVKYNKKTKLIHFIDRDGKPIGKGYAVLRKPIQLRRPNLVHNEMVYFVAADKPKGKVYIINRHGQRLMNLPKFEDIVSYKDADLDCAALFDNGFVTLLTFHDCELHQSIITQRTRWFSSTLGSVDVFQPRANKLIFVVNKTVMDYYEFVNHVKKQYGFFSARRWMYLNGAKKLYTNVTIIDRGV